VSRPDCGSSHAISAARLRAALQGESIAACDDVDGISWYFGALRHITEAFGQ
jgi:hypothetical protein